MANGITRVESSKSATARDTKNKLESCKQNSHLVTIPTVTGLSNLTFYPPRLTLRRVLSVKMAMHTKILPKMLTVMSKDSNRPIETCRNICPEESIDKLVVNSSIIDFWKQEMLTYLHEFLEKKYHCRSCCLLVTTEKEIIITCKVVCITLHNSAVLLRILAFYGFS